MHKIYTYGVQTPPALIVLRVSVITLKIVCLLHDRCQVARQMEREAGHSISRLKVGRHGILSLRFLYAGGV